MPKVQLFRGTKERLDTAPLNDGGIYFIPEEKRLYIDTSTRRVPIMGGGLEFYLHLTPESWSSENGIAQATTSLYYLKKDKIAPSLSLKDVLSTESIIFIGHIYEDNYAQSTFIDDIEIAETPSGDLIAKPYRYAQTADATRQYFEFNSNNQTLSIGGESKTADFWLYLYCPNPNLAGIAAPVQTTVLTTSATIYGLDDNEDTPDWYYDTVENNYKYELFIDEIDLTKYAYIMTLGDDSLENYDEYYTKHIQIAEILYDESRYGTSIIFTAGEEIGQPNFNITFDLVVFVGEEQDTDVNGFKRYNIYDFNFDSSEGYSIKYAHALSADFSAFNFEKDDDQKYFSIKGNAQNRLGNTDLFGENYKLVYNENNAEFSSLDKDCYEIIKKLGVNETFTALPPTKFNLTTRINNWNSSSNRIFTYVYPLFKENINLDLTNLQVTTSNEKVKIIMTSGTSTEAMIDQYNQEPKDQLIIFYSVQNAADNKSVTFYYYLEEGKSAPPIIPLHLEIALWATPAQDPVFLFYPQESNGPIIYDYFIDAVARPKYYAAGGKIYVDEISFQSDKAMNGLNGCTVTAVQLNNLSNLHEVVLRADGWAKISAQDLEYNKINGNLPRNVNVYYYQAFPNAQYNFTLLNNHSPLIFATDNKAEFRNIVETKITQTGKLYFYTGLKPTQDIPIIIADFK